MTSRRVLKAAEAIREVVGMAILVDLRDPRVSDVTVIRVEVSGDMRTAKVYVSIMGDEKKQTLGLRGLESAAGFLQAKVANRIDTRYTPRLAFVLDQGVKKSLEVNRILREVLPSTSREEGSRNDDPSADDSLAAKADVAAAAEDSPPAIEIRESSL